MHALDKLASLVCHDYDYLRLCTNEPCKRWLLSLYGLFNSPFLKALGSASLVLEDMTGNLNFMFLQVAALDRVLTRLALTDETKLEQVVPCSHQEMPHLPELWITELHECSTICASSAGSGGFSF